MPPVSRRWKQLTRSAALSIGTAALLALASCSFHSGFDGTSYQCGAGDSCPSGYVCMDGVCVPPGQGSDGGGGAPDAAPQSSADAATDAGTAQATCGGIALLQDDFANGIKGPLWNQWSDTGASASESGGLFHVNLDAGTADAWAGRTSRALYDLTGSSIAVTVPQVGGQHTVLELRDPDDRRLQVDYHDGNLYAKVFASDGSQIAVASVAYDAVSQARWRIREDGGMIYWETSPDGQIYTELFHAPVPFAIDSLRAILAAGGQLSAASEIQFDDLNLPAPPDLPGYCPFASIHDDFADGIIGPPWDGTWADTGASVTEEGGSLVMSFPGTGDIWAGAETWHLYDLTDSELVLDVPALTGYSNFETYAQVVSLGGGNSLLIERAEGTLYVTVYVAGAQVQSSSVTYDPIAHRFWRFRAAGALARVDTSPDAVNWTTRLTTANAVFDMSNLRVELAAGHWAPGPGQAVTTRFDAVNP